MLSAWTRLHTDKQTRTRCLAGCPLFLYLPSLPPPCLFLRCFLSFSSSSEFCNNVLVFSLQFTSISHTLFAIVSHSLCFTPVFPLLLSSRFHPLFFNITSFILCKLHFQSSRWTLSYILDNSFLSIFFRLLDSCDIFVTRQSLPLASSI